MTLTAADRKQEYKALHKLWTAFDRSTAYGCAIRHQPFDLAKCEELRRTYFAALDAYADSLSAARG